MVTETVNHTAPRKVPVDGWPPHHYFAQLSKVIPICATTNELVFDVYEHDCVHKIQMADYKQSDGALSSSRPLRRLFTPAQITDHPGYHLADYFQCDWLLQRYRKQALVVVEKSATHKLYLSAPWRILHLADKYKWPDVRAACLEVCKTHTDCFKHDSWSELTSRLSTVTMQDLLKTLYSCKQ